MARPSSSGDGGGADRSRPVDREEQRSREGGRACRKPGGCSACLRERPTLCSENQRRPDSSICTDERLIGTCSDIAATCTFYPHLRSEAMSRGSSRYRAAAVVRAGRPVREQAEHFQRLATMETQP